MQIILLIIFLVIFCGLPGSISFILALLAGIILGLIEGVAVPLLAGIFSYNYNLGEIISSPMLRIVFALLSLVLLAILAYITDRRGWRLPLIDRMSVSREEQKGYLTSHNHLFSLCLLQALILIFLYLILYNYYAEVFPGFTLETLGIISGAVLIASSLLTILLAGYFLKITEREAKLESKLNHLQETNRLNLQMQVERHEFCNHLTSVYGYIKTEQYRQAENYIEKLYENASQTESFLSMNPPELGALLSIKQGEADDRGIDFHWQVDIEAGLWPLSPEDLTQITGNLLDNALEATVPMGRVDLSIKSNKMGLQIRASNKCKPISQRAQNKMFAAGYTTKKEHSGLGLYIVKQIVERNDGWLELREAKEYLGVEFVIHIPWKC
ncbi:MAG: GHKL domain-containing protein [Syntrophaceticus sp.]|nr:GHKL domain-containing protein [Syntrophaceticus sp.]